MIERSESMSGAGEAGANLSDLLGCPSCDGTKIIPMRSVFGGYYYECLACGRMSSLFGHNTPDEARAAWNERAT